MVARHWILFLPLKGEAEVTAADEWIHLFSKSDRCTCPSLSFFLDFKRRKGSQPLGDEYGWTRLEAGKNRDPPAYAGEAK